MTNSQKLYVAAHTAALESLETDEKESTLKPAERSKPSEVEARAIDAFKKAGFSLRPDLQFFLTWFHDERLKIRKIGVEKLTSEKLAETV